MRHVLVRLLIAAVALAVAACSAAAPSASPIVPSGLATASPSAIPPTRALEFVTPTPSASPSALPTTIPSAALPTPTASTPHAEQPDTEYDLYIEPGLDPKWEPQAAADAGMRILRGWGPVSGQQFVPPDITAVRAVSGRKLPRQFGGPAPEYRVVWIVSADGTFVNSQGYQVTYGSSGYFTFDDQGNAIGMGSHSG